MATLTDHMSTATPQELAHVREVGMAIGATSLSGRLMCLDRWLRRLGQGGEHGHTPLVALLTIRELTRALRASEQDRVKLQRELRAVETQEALRVKRARRRKGIG